MELAFKPGQWVKVIKSNDTWDYYVEELGLEQEVAVGMIIGMGDKLCPGGCIAFPDKQNYVIDGWNNWSKKIVHHMHIASSENMMLMDETEVALYMLGKI